MPPIKTRLCLSRLLDKRQPKNVLQDPISTRARPDRRFLASTQKIIPAMKIRLFIFITAVLLLPAAGLFLSGAEWADLEARALGGDDAIINPPSTLLTT